MSLRYYLKKYFQDIIFINVFVLVISLWISSVNASTIDQSEISINIDVNGICNVEENLYITAIDEKESYIWNYSQYPSIQLTRGEGISDLYIDDLEIAQYYDEWWSNRNNNYEKNTNIINLFFPKQSRKISIPFSL